MSGNTTGERRFGSLLIGLVFRWLAGAGHGALQTPARRPCAQLVGHRWLATARLTRNRRAAARLTVPLQPMGRAKRRSGGARQAAAPAGRLPPRKAAFRRDPD